MQCERCRKNPARVRIDQMVDGQRGAYYLCQTCVDEMMSDIAQGKEPTNKTDKNYIPALGAVQSQEQGSKNQDSKNIAQQLKAIDERLNALDEKLRQLQITRDEQTILLAQILARLPDIPQQ